MSHPLATARAFGLSSALLLTLTLAHTAHSAPYMALTAGRTTGKGSVPANLLGIRFGGAVDAFGINVSYTNVQFQLPGQDPATQNLLSFGLEIVPIRPQLSRHFWSRVGVYGEGGWIDGTASYLTGGLVLSMLSGSERYCDPNNSRRVFPRYFWGANAKVGFISSQGSAPLNGLVFSLELPIIMNPIPDGWPQCP